MQRIHAGAERELHPPAVAFADGQAVTDTHAATEGGRLTAVVLVTEITVGGEIVVCQSEMRSGKEAVIVLRQPVAELRLEGERAELDGGLEIVPCRVIDGKRERPVLRQVHFDSDIGDGQPPAEGVGFQMQMPVPFFYGRDDGFRHRHGVRLCFLGFNGRFGFHLRDGGNGYRLPDGRDLLLVRDDYCVGIPHTAEVKPVHLQIGRASCRERV